MWHVTASWLNSWICRVIIAATKGIVYYWCEIAHNMSWKNMTNETTRELWLCRLQMIMSLRGAIQHVVGALSLIILVNAIDKYSVWYLLQASYTSQRKYVEGDHNIKLNAVMHYNLYRASWFLSLGRKILALRDIDKKIGITRVWSILVCKCRS